MRWDPFVVILGRLSVRVPLRAVDSVNVRMRFEPSYTWTDPAGAGTPAALTFTVITALLVDFTLDGRLHDIDDTALLIATDDPTDDAGPVEPEPT